MIIIFLQKIHSTPFFLTTDERHDIIYGNYEKKENFFRLYKMNDDDQFTPIS